MRYNFSTELDPRNPRSPGAENLPPRLSTRYRSHERSIASLHRFAIVATLALALALLGGVDATAQITQVIDSTGDGAGNTLSDTYDVAVDNVGNVYVTGATTDNAVANGSTSANVRL